MSTSAALEPKKDEDPMLMATKEEADDSTPSPPNPGGEATASSSSGRKKKEEENADIFLTEEVELRKWVKNGFSGNPVKAIFANGYSSLLIFLLHLISLESLLSIALSVTLTIYAYNRMKESQEPFDGSIMDWVLLSFAVITPMSSSIGMAYTRREQALQYLAVIKSSLKGIYTAYASWDWSSSSKPQPSGRAASAASSAASSASSSSSSNQKKNVDYFMQQSDIALHAMVKLCSDLTRMLTLPSSSRGRHRVLSKGKIEAEQIEKLMNNLHRSALRRMLVISDVCEVLKYEGMPGNEAARIRQWERFVTEKIELLIVIKRYRTPQALRSFARIFSVFLPPFYAPFYGQMASDLNSLGMAIAFSVWTSVALTSLFESITQIEDPFVGMSSLDGINVAKELQDNFTGQLLDVRKHQFPDAKDIELESRALSLPAGPDILLLQAT